MKFLKEEDGVSALEYGLIAAGIAVALGTIISAFTGSLTTLFTSIFP